MTINSKNLLLYLLLILGGSVLGFLAGGYIGSNFGMGLILNSTISKDARDLQSKLSALRALRASEFSVALETIEASVDDQLVIFDPREPYPGLDEATQLQLDLTIEAAYRYRQDFPRQSDRAHVDAMVKALFQFMGSVSIENHP